MANYMFILRPGKNTRKVVCAECAKRGEVVDTCSCRGTGIKKETVPAYFVQDRPVEIDRVDRDPETGILRYWQGSCDYFYETIYPSLNRYVPEVPYGVHLCHETSRSAQAECERINKFLATQAVKNKCKSFDF